MPVVKVYIEHVLAGMKALVQINFQLEQIGFDM